MINPQPREGDAAGQPRALTPADLIRRVRALDALYLNAERRYREWMALRDSDDKAALGRACERYLEARREYERVRLTPYTIAEREQ